MIILILTLLAVPTLGYFASSIIIENINTDLSNTFESDMSIIAFCSPDNVYLIGELGLQSMCKEMLWIGRLEWISVTVAIAGVGYMVLVKMMATVAGADRQRNAQIFPLLVTLSILFIGAMVLAQGAIATFAIYELQVQLVGSWYPMVTVGIGLGALMVSLAVISATTKIKTKASMVQRATIAAREKFPALWEFVEEIASSTGSSLPDHIVIGLEPNFYATGAEVHALSDDTKISGETLYLSLPLMRLFDKKELAAVVGHELGHFKGADVQYTLKFAPIYRALNTAVSNVGNQESVMTIPALSMLRYLHNSFEMNEKQISRDREFEADQNGAKASSAEALVTSLVKLSVFSQFWNTLQQSVINSLDYGRPVKNMSRLYTDSVAFDTNPTGAREVAIASANSVIHHPTDSHPTLAQRMNALNISEDILKTVSLTLPENSSATLLPQLREIEEQLTTDEQKFYVTLGLATWESDKPEGEGPYVFARFIQLAAAVMVCADGKVEAAEIEAAEALGNKLITGFNALEFRELCHNPQDLPEATGLGENIRESFTEPEALEQLREYLVAIAESDGFVDESEQLFIDSFLGDAGHH